MLDSDSPYVHNATSTKQNVGADTDIAVLASNLRTGFYWHAFRSLSPTPPPAASDLSISASPANRSIRRGGSATYTAGTTATWTTNPVVVAGEPVSTDPAT